MLAGDGCCASTRGGGEHARFACLSQAGEAQPLELGGQLQAEALLCRRRALAETSGGPDVDRTGAEYHIRLKVHIVETKTGVTHRTPCFQRVWFIVVFSAFL